MSKENLSIRLDAETIQTLDEMISDKLTPFESRSQIVDYALKRIFNNDLISVPERLNRIESNLVELNGLVSNLDAKTLAVLRKSKRK